MFILYNRHNTHSVLCFCKIQRNIVCIYCYLASDSIVSNTRDGSRAGAATTIIFVATCLCHDKTCLLSRQKYARSDKSFVVTKRILVAAPASDTRVFSKADRIGRANELTGNGSVIVSPRVRTPDGFLARPPVH